MKEKEKKLWLGMVRVALMVLAVLCFIIFWIPLSLSVTLNMGNATGLTLSVLLFLYGLFLPWVHKILKQWRAHKVLRWLHWGIFGVIGIIAFLVVLESALMIHAASRKPEPGATVVVLGCRVYGERASLSMRGL